MLDLTVHTADSAPEGSRPGIDAARKAFGFVPNLIGALANAPAALDGYLGVADAFERSSLTKVEQQVVLLATSVENRCHYCVAAHSTVAGMVGADEGAVRSLRTEEPMDDPRLEALRRFTTSVVRHRGWVPDADLETFLAAGFSKAQVLEVVTGVTQKTLSNYVNHLAATPLDGVFERQAWAGEVVVAAD